MMPTVYIKSLGCDKNTVDAQIMHGALESAGFAVVRKPAGADAIIVNTCGFTQAAVQESVDATLQLAKYRTSRTVLVVAGCMSERFGQQISAHLPEADVIFGAQAPQSIADALAGRFAHMQAAKIPQNPAMMRMSAQAASRLPHTAYVKLAEGCDECCTYCTIPQIRGAYRSRPLADIVEECRALCAGGVREVVLVAQNTARYGADLPQPVTLAQAIREIAATGPAWIRLMYLNPQDITDEIIHTMASVPQVCPYIDMPLQHSEAAVLGRMGRTGDAARYAAIIARLRNEVPGIAIRTSIMVGFPGESAADFVRLAQFVRAARFERMGVFEYSREDGTPAAAMPQQLKPATKALRRHRIMQMQQKIHFARQAKLVGQIIPCIIDRQAHPGKYVARSCYDAPEVDSTVYVRGTDLRAGDICAIKITRARGYDLVGVVN